LIVINSAIVALNLTNDFHLFVHPLDVNDPDWILNYGYSYGFYLWQAGWLLPLLAAVIIMLTKIGVYVRKKMLVLPFLSFMMLLVYQYAYINRIPFAWESNRIMVNGIFVLLFIESIIRSALIPVNTKYQAFFSNSPLNMRIIDNAKNTAISSASAAWYDYDTFSNAINSYPEPARNDDNTLLFAAPIVGGYALWQEDISALNRLHKEIEESVKKLHTANAVLAEEGKIRHAAQEESEKTKLMEQLEGEINSYTIRLSTMIEQLENAVDKPKATARITLLLCYIKRRCNLFFRERETDTLAADELMVYLDELAEMAGYADVTVISTCEIRSDIDLRQSTLFYDFFNNVVYWATWVKGARILANLGIENGNIVLRLLPNEDARSFQMNKTVIAAIASADGKYTVKDLDDGVGLSLSFPSSFTAP